MAGDQISPVPCVAILICSDRAHSGERDDQTGPELVQKMQQLGWEVSDPEVLPDNQEAIADWLKINTQSGDFDIVLTSGGTGLAKGDVTPEATLQVIERRVPGIEEAMRAASLKITPHAMLSRGIVGVAGKTLIINLPGSPKGALENLEIILPALPHAVALLRGEKPDP